MTMSRRFSALIVVSCIAWGASADGANATISLVPKPMQIEQKPGEFSLDANTAILVDKDSPDAANVGRQLAERIERATGYVLKVSPGDGGDARNAIVVTSKDADAKLGAEGYRLDVTPEGATIRATGGAGMFYGMQTLLQLFPPAIFGKSKAEGNIAWTAPAVRIADRPRFVWRDLHLDVSRHFFNKEEVKNYIDLLAQHKFNTFHFHLVDDQGWRIEIKRYPKLTEMGAWRKDIGFGLNPKDGTAYGPDGRYGGFYTQDDIRELVAYAKARYVTIMPEIEMPGHACAALAAYPSYSCEGRPGDAPRDGGIFNGVYCAGNDGAFEFLENVLSEVIDLFPSKYIHIGGDEVPKDNWNKCPKCQARIKKEGLANAHELQSYFIKRIEKFVNGRGRTIIGWDEILEGGLAPNAVVMSWRGMNGGIAAANAGHDVVMTPASHCYFDYLQAKTGEPKGIGGFLPLETVYQFEPVPASLSADKAKHILGGGGNLWSEYFPNYAQVQYMTYPRACALAEAVWSDAKSKDWKDFQTRLESHLQRLKAQDVKYRP